MTNDYIKAQDMRSPHTRIFAALGGGNITVTDAEGVVQFVVGFDAGVHFASKLASEMRQHDRAYLDGNITVTIGQAGGRSRPMRYQSPDGVQTGANPDWRPTAATAQQRQMEHMLGQITKQNKALDKRLRTFERLAQEDAARRAEQAASAEPEPEVIDTAEPEPAPTPAPEPAPAADPAPSPAPAPKGGGDAAKNG